MRDLRASVKMTLQRMKVKTHDTALFFFRYPLIEIEILFIVVHEREEHAGEGGGPQVQQEVLVLFWLEETDAMDLHPAERFAVDKFQQAGERASNMLIHPVNG